MISKSKRFGVVTLIIGLFLVALSLSACSGNETGVTDGYESNKIRLNYGASYASVVPQLLMLRGTLEQMVPDGVTVEWISSGRSADVRDALVTDRIDIGTFSSPGVIAAIANGFPINILCNSAQQTCIIYSSNPDVRSLEDINQTSKISTQSIGGAYHLALMFVGKELFGDARKFDVNLLNMAYADMFATVETSNMLDAAIVGFPYTLMADEIDKMHPIFDLTPTLMEYNISSFTAASESFYSNNPLLVEITLRAFKETMDFLVEHPGESARILSDFYGDIDADSIEEQIRSLPPQLEISESAFDKVAELMFEVGIIPNQPKKFAELPNYNSILKVP